jgi:hypothetical protein
MHDQRLRSLIAAVRNADENLSIDDATVRVPKTSSILVMTALTTGSVGRCGDELPSPEAAVIYAEHYARMTLYRARTARTRCELAFPASPEDAVHGCSTAVPDRSPDARVVAAANAW